MTTFRPPLGWLAALAGCVAVTGVLCHRPQYSAAQSPLDSKPLRELLDATNWPTDRVELSDGRKLQGLIQSEDARGMMFVEIHREPGKPMGGVVRPLNHDWIASVQRLEGEDRELLVKRIAAFRQRLAIEAAKADNISLRRNTRGGVEYQDYAGQYFSLASTANEETTRKCIVRIEQLFTAFTGILPPRQPTRPRLSVLLFGSTDEYAAYCKQHELKLENPSFYAIDRNLIVAGSELSRYARQLEIARGKYAAVRREYAQYDAQLPALLTQLNADLTEQGVTKDEAQKVMNATRRRWTDEKAESEKRIAKAERECEADFVYVTDHMFQRLGHETFHAYLENFVYPSASYDVPRWLNEGLAQIFEHGHLDVDTLRLDAPAAELLSGLQAELKSGNSLALADVLTADRRAFLVGHPDSAAASRQHYLYSWGLAYYLTFQRPVLLGDQLSQFVDRKAKELGPIKRFEQLVGMPLADFERQWRADMLRLSKNSRPQSVIATETPSEGFDKPTPAE